MNLTENIVSWSFLFTVLESQITQSFLAKVCLKAWLIAVCRGYRLVLDVLSVLVHSVVFSFICIIIKCSVIVFWLEDVNFRRCWAWLTLSGLLHRS